MHKNKVCPSCMEEVQENEEICPPCGWEFPKKSIQQDKNDAERNLNDEIQRNRLQKADFPNEEHLKMNKKTSSVHEKTTFQQGNRQFSADSWSVNVKSEFSKAKTLKLGLCIDRTGSSEQFQRGIYSCCNQIFNEIEPIFDDIHCFMQSHGDLDYSEQIILHIDGDSPQQTLDDISRLTFEGGGDLHETHLDAIEHMLKILPPSNPPQNSLSALVVFCTSETKPTKSGISAEELGTEVRRLGISMLLVCELTPTFHKLCKSARGFMLPISPSPSKEDIQQISSHISSILTQISLF